MGLELPVTDGALELPVSCMYDRVSAQVGTIVEAFVAHATMEFGACEWGRMIVRIVMLQRLL